MDQGPCTAPCGIVGSKRLTGNRDIDMEDNRERILLDIRRYRRLLRGNTDPAAARALDGLLREAEARLAKLREDSLENAPARKWAN